MFRALRIGLTGLQANQTYIDVVGNNLVNGSTAGFKSDRVTFGDAFYQTFSTGSGPDGNLGGTNGRQVGLGVALAGMSQNHAQGASIATGRTFDMAIQGNGFFVLSDGNQQVFSRVGTFDLDRDGNLVDSRSGYRVLNDRGQAIVLDTQAVQPATPTSMLDFRGNLPAKVSGPLPEIQSSAVAYEESLPPRITGANLAGTTDVSGQDLSIAIGTGAPITITFDAASTAQTAAQIRDEANALLAAEFPEDTPYFTLAPTGELVLNGGDTGDSARIEITGGAAAGTLGLSGFANGSESVAVASTLLNDLGSNVQDYVPGDVINITGVASDGTTVNVPFVFGTGPGQDGETLGAFQSKIAAAFPDTTVTLVAGKLRMEANASGVNPLSVSVQDAAGNTGSSNLSVHSLSTVQEGTAPDSATTSIEIYDSLGIAHTLTGVFEREDGANWKLTLEIPEGEGTITGSSVMPITFNDDGTYQGGANVAVDIAFSNGSAPQTVRLDLGDPNGLDGLTQFSDTTSARFSNQDGSPSGTLASFAVTQSGTIQGTFTNGKIVEIDTVGVARFRNVGGLLKEGTSYFMQSDNSGIPVVGRAAEDGAGAVLSGSLEGSNVDTSEQFVELINAQRSFQSSARIITSANELFNEVLQLL